MNAFKLPEGDRIYDLFTGVYKPQVIRVALALDIFSLIEAGRSKAEEIAQACKCNVEGIHRLLDYLASLQVLAKQGDDYALTPDAAAFLVRGKKSYAGDLIMDFTGPAPWESLIETIRSGQARKIDLDIHFAQDAWIESYRSVRIPSSLDMWAKIGIIPAEDLHLKLLDIACGCAIKSLVLAQKSHGVKLTCLDTPLVLEPARDLARRWDVLPQVRFVADDLLTAELGEGVYDACLLGQITHYLTREQNISLFSRIHRALVPGGKLVLDVPMEAEQLDEGSSFLSLLLWANSGGRAYSYEKYRSLILDAGFRSVVQHSERLLSAMS